MIRLWPPQWREWCDLAACASYRFGRYRTKKISSFSQARLSPDRLLDIARQRPHRIAFTSGQCLPTTKLFEGSAMSAIFAAPTPKSVPLHLIDRAEAKNWLAAGGIEAQKRRQNPKLVRQTGPDPVPHRAGSAGAIGHWIWRCRRAKTETLRRGC